MLGPLEVVERDARVEIAGRKERALLVALALRAGEPVPSSQLIATLWDDAAPRTAVKILQTYVFRLRRALAPSDVLDTRSGSYVLAVPRHQVDALRFEDTVASARKAWKEGDAARTSALLRQALALWRSEKVGDHADTLTAKAQVARLAEMRLTAIEDRLEANLALGGHSEAAAELEELVTAHPFRERLWGLLIVALYRSGRQAAALRTFSRARSQLVEELGVEPLASLRALEAAVLVQDPALDLPRVDAATPERGFVGPTEAGRGRFVGRQREQAQLVRALQAARLGHGSLFLVTGEPGIGKTRLVEELTEHARAGGMQVAWGPAWEAGGAPAFWPWIQALRAISDQLAPETVVRAVANGNEHLAAWIPTLAERLPSRGERAADTTSEQARFDLFDATARFLRHAAKETPLLLALDDMHAADEPSLLLLSFIARQLRDWPLVVVATSREVEARLVPWVAESLANATRFGHRLPLRGLSGVEVQELVEHIADLVPSPDLATEVHKATGGNPFFVDELVRLLASEGRLGPGAPAPSGRLDVPGGVRETVRRRLAPLSPASRDVLATAAVAGRHFELTVVGTACSRPLDEVLTLLHEAGDLDLVVPDGDSPTSFRFAHALVRDSLYDELPAVDRAQRHWRVAQALEQLPARAAAELAHHSRAAMVVAGSSMALQYSLAAAEHAMEALAFEEATRQYRYALDALDALSQPGPLQRCRIVLALADACFAVGETAERDRLVLEAAAIARREGDAALLAEAAQRAPVRGSDGEPAMTLITTALSLLPPAPSRLRVQLLRRLAWAEGNSVFADRSAQTVREALLAARELGDPDVLIQTLDTVDYLLPYDAEEHGRVAAELTRVAIEARSTAGLMHAHKFRIREMLYRGDLAGVDDELARHRLLAEESRFAPALSAVKRWRVMRLLLGGRFAEADALVSEMEAGPQREVDPLHIVTVFHLRMEQGRLDGMERALRRLVVESPQYPWRTRLAALLSEQDRVDEARSEFEVLAQHEFTDVRGFTADFELPLLAEVCAFLNDAPRARVLMRRLSPAVGRCVVVGGGIYACTGAVSRYLGLLASALGDWDEAERHLADALRLHETMPSPPLVARTQNDLGAVLLRRGRRGDRERARSLACSSVSAADDMGMRLVAQKARSLLDRTGPAAPASASGGNGTA